ncbi:MAG: HD domain-containing protein [Micavibrio sp.]|nr:HD domain-containing protein [Micavibrio sp.]
MLFMDQVLKKITDVFTGIYQGAGDAVFNEANEADRPSLKAAFNYAAKKHEGQTRRGQQPRPYTDHLLMVWFLTHISGQSLEAQQAALLHDVAEDCLKNAETQEDILKEIKNLFGENVSSICRDLTLPLGMEDTDEAELDFISKIPKGSQPIKSCDNLANLWDAIHDTPKKWTGDRIKEDVVFRSQIKDLVTQPASLLDKLFAAVSTLAGEPKSPVLKQSRIVVRPPQPPKP